jgi:hypothetical protein
MVDSIENVIDISEEIWKELEASSAVEAPLRMRINQTLRVRWS